MPTDDREQQFERVLARRLRDASPDSQCPDAETLAAYHERTLSLDRMALWKEHIAGCARCQETLALVERSEDVQTEFVHGEEWESADLLASKVEALAGAVPRAAAPRMASSEIVAATPAVEPGTLPVVRRRPPWRWIVPLGTIAACVIGWIGVREIRTQQYNQALVAQAIRREANNPPLSVPTVPPASETQEQLKNERTPAPTPENSVRDRKQAESAGAAPKAAPGAGQGAITVNGMIASSSESTSLAAPRKQAAAVGRAAAASRNPAPSASDAATSTTAVEVTAAPAVPPAAAASNSATPTPAVAQKEPATSPAASESVAVQSQAFDAGANAASSDLELRASKGLHLLAAMAAADHRYIVAPGEKSAWRVGEAGKIEHSTDHGKTWKTQRSGVTADLTSGSATSDKICWVVGKSGAILLSTDGGKHWKPILSPIEGDLGGIHATDALHASVWDVANRISYGTSDGGETWTRSANE
jgi:photosystem II stability/assembly factor-like uncharacterized protein